ncbi:MAG: HIT domain-containing protein [Opitutales bacterium]|nr:HIT domain-containing protein [Opitutales bacterium]
MDFLHSYWRMEYVEAPKENKATANPFLDLPNNENDEETLILIRGKHHYVVMNRYPYNAGHLMVIPYREVPDLDDLDEEEQLEFIQLVIRAKKMLKDAIHPDAFNVGMNLGVAAGAGIPWHLHCHIVPRWQGDTNFMPVLGKTRVLPTSLNSLWKRLKEFAD